MSTARIASSTEGSVIHQEPVLVLAVDDRNEKAPLMVTLGLAEPGRTIKAKVWKTLRRNGGTVENPVATFVRGLGVGTPITVSGKLVPGYKGGAMEFDLVEAGPLSMDHPIVGDARPKPVVPVKTLTAQLDEHLAALTGPVGDLTRALLGEGGVYRERFIASPAAIGLHHNYGGGLLEHTLEVADGVMEAADSLDVKGNEDVAKIIHSLPDAYHALLTRAVVRWGGDMENLHLHMTNGWQGVVTIARRLARRYGAPGELVDIDLLTTGAILAHLGGTPKRGSLVTSIDEFVPMVTVRAVNLRSAAIEAEALGGEVVSEDTLAHLTHLIISVHGDQAEGSPTVPCTPEAKLLYAAVRSQRTLLGRGVLTPTEVNLLRAGALLHDLGKLEEYALERDLPVMGEHAALYGHLTGGVSMLVEQVERLGITVRDGDLRMLMHYIVSHHGKLEWGSPIAPATPLAELLHVSDHTSAVMAAGMRHLRLTGEPLNDRRHGIVPSPSVRARLQAAAIPAPTDDVLPEAAGLDTPSEPQDLFGSPSGPKR